MTGVNAFFFRWATSAQDWNGPWNPAFNTILGSKNFVGPETLIRQEISSRRGGRRAFLSLHQITSNYAAVGPTDSLPMEFSFSLFSSSKNHLVQSTPERFLQNRVPAGGISFKCTSPRKWFFLLSDFYGLYLSHEMCTDWTSSTFNTECNFIWRFMNSLYLITMRATRIIKLIL